MKYDIVQQSLEEFVQANWTETSVQYDNVAFNSDLYTEYMRCSIVFGDGLQRSVTAGCYRVVGLLILSCFVKPAIGTARLMQLASIASTMVVSKIVSPAPPVLGPKVNLKVPDMYPDFTEHSGWVMAQVSCPFYYDLEI